MEASSPAQEAVDGRPDRVTAAVKSSKSVAFCGISRVIVKFGRVGLGLKWAVVSPHTQRILCDRLLGVKSEKSPAMRPSHFGVSGRTATSLQCVPGVRRDTGLHLGVDRTQGKYGDEGEADLCYEPPATTEAPSTLTSTSRMATGSSSSKSSGTGKYPP